MSEASPNFVLDSERLKRVVAERDALKARVEKLREALQVIDGAIYNDNGDVTTDLNYIGIKRVCRAALADLDAAPGNG